ncbi:hypothetical protein KI387_031692, partial [Taxus chinensis]
NQKNIDIVKHKEFNTVGRSTGNTGAYTGRKLKFGLRLEGGGKAGSFKREFAVVHSMRGEGEVVEDKFMSPKEEKLQPQSSSESESDDEGAEEVHLHALEEALVQNPHNYDAHVQYIKALRKYSHVEKLQIAREAMSSLFPLSPAMWQEWAKDETCLNSSSEAVSSIEQLYERGLCDYMSVPLWSDYLNFMQECDESVSQCTQEGTAKIRALFERALTAAGLHMSEGGKLWTAYREFEQALLITMEENDGKVKSKQVDRIRNIFRRQLSVPLVDMDATLEDYKAWEQQQGNVIRIDIEHLTGFPSIVIAAYRKAVEMYKSRADHEEKLAVGKNADTKQLQHYLNYINFEKSSGDPARVQVLYERAITEFPVVTELWLDYTHYLDSSLKVPHIIKAVYARAVRSCPWVEALWAKYMLALERFDASEEELSRVFELSLQCGFSNPEENLDLFLTRADGLRRKIMKRDEISNTSWVALLRETFQRAAEYLSQNLNYTDQFLHLHAYWARLECQLAKDMAAARGVWESLIKKSGSILEVWQGYIDMELALNNVSEARAIYKRCYSKRFKGNGSEVICKAWAHFEREHGSLVDLDQALIK